MHFWPSSRICRGPNELSFYYDTTLSNSSLGGESNTRRSICQSLYPQFNSNVQRRLVVFNKILSLKCLFVRGFTFSIFFKDHRVRHVIDCICNLHICYLHLRSSYASLLQLHVQICQKGRRIGCVIPRCNLQHGIM